MAIAQTGTGKTAAFAIPVIDILLRRIARPDTESIRCLVMVPTRELAVQIACEDGRLIITLVERQGLL